ncbi:hypothetical protein ADUPG1_012237 [Aduncisulcus paluster]|uniref:NLE domain-containing protein n=1 Tax=Aduncisulcus paluster TaxID=2918883 RepID=A0ABQ5JYR8_9EUKA|nr:hypothetical protein ADUPG1_012237 [Aduncisulcus paluster]|eukprot:gnl/Carplike_NY0171/4816_a6562_307.p1 GENE.gnl/Carplike_NY0171/4816_a6562_307~~gnl/Carplike_NY0171/4816_a6562_307.p1  ORF type:complete len:472 (+),score=112.80 gnl/Carplike_NY0171/4816_a6562_307:2-1417(+)
MDKIFARFVSASSLEAHIGPLPDEVMALDPSMDRESLSSLINQLCDLPKRKEFDFIINGNNFLLSDLKSTISSSSLTEEDEIEIEVTLALPEPKPQLSAPHDDWVSAIKVYSHDKIVTGSYDGTIHLWKYCDGKEEDVEPAYFSDLSAYAAHTDPIKDIDVLSFETGEKYVVTVGLDSRVSLCRIEETDESASISYVTDLGEHDDSILTTTSMIYGDNGIVCVGGNEGIISVFNLSNTGLSGSTDLSSAKRRKKRRSTASSLIPPQKASLKLKGHSHAVISSILTASNLYTGSDDHSIRTWDIKTGECTGVTVSPSVVTDLDVRSPFQSPVPTSPYLLASAHSDRRVRVWDMRASVRKRLTATLVGHKGMVQNVSFPHHELSSTLPSSLSRALLSHVLLSVSFDGKTNVWDLRSPYVPLYSIDTRTDGLVASSKPKSGEDEARCLCCAWPMFDRMFVGCTDCSLRCYTLDI